jgi:enamine deaminase RidA (YjgF/YER057c/UK114 family)
MIKVVEVPGWNKRLTFSPGVRAGDFIFVSGLTATDEEGNLLHRGDIVEQTRAIYQKIGRILAAHGAGVEHIVDTLEFFIPDARYNQTAKVRRELFGSAFPTATGIPVQSLIREGALIEIKVVAYAPESSAK